MSSTNYFNEIKKELFTFNNINIILFDIRVWHAKMYVQNLKVLEEIQMLRDYITYSIKYLSNK